MRSLHSLGALFGAALLILPASEVGARKKKTKLKPRPRLARLPMRRTPKVVTKDKTDLRARRNDLAKVVKHLKKKEKLDYVSRSPDGKWVQVPQRARSKAGSRRTCSKAFLHLTRRWRWGRLAPAETSQARTASQAGVTPRQGVPIEGGRCQAAREAA